MMLLRRCVFALCLTTLAAGCTSSRPAGADGDAALTGTVTYLPRIALPPDARLHVQLSDVSRADAPSVTIAEQTIGTRGRQVPIAFTLRYDPSRIEPRHRYAVRAEIRDGDGTLRWVSDTVHPVLTQGAPAGGVEVRVVQVQRGASAPQDGLSGSAWRLDGIARPDGTASVVEAREPLTLTFFNEGRFGGQADCNSYGGSYQAHADGRITLSEIVTTLAACAQPSWGEELIDALGGVTQYSVRGDKLRLEAGDGRALLFNRMAERPETGGMNPQPTGVTSVFTCAPAGGESFSITVRTGPGELAVWLPPRFGSRYVVLGQTRAASGARYEGDGIVVWNKGEEASVEIDGEVFTGCAASPHKAVWEEARRLGVDFRAVGQEPGWHLEIREGERITMVLGYGGRTVVVPAPDPREEAGQTLYHARTEAHDLRVTVANQACTDTMSGEVFEQTVVAELDGATYRGCGRYL